MATIKETNYLAITAMLAARTSGMLSLERMERMIAAPSDDEAVKVLEECGYGDLSGLSLNEINAELDDLCKLFLRLNALREYFYVVLLAEFD